MFNLSESFYRERLANGGYPKILQESGVPALGISDQPPGSNEERLEVNQAIRELAERILKVSFLELFSEKARESLFQKEVWPAPITLFENLRVLSPYPTFVRAQPSHDDAMDSEVEIQPRRGMKRQLEEDQEVDTGANKRLRLNDHPR